MSFNFFRKIKAFNCLDTGNHFELVQRLYIENFSVHRYLWELFPFVAGACVIFEDLKLGVSYFDVVWYNCSFTHAFMETTNLKNQLKKKLRIFLIRIMRSILLFLCWKLIYSLLVKNYHIWNNFRVNHFSLTVNKVYLVKYKTIVSGVIDNKLIPKIFFAVLP